MISFPEASFDSFGSTQENLSDQSLEQLAGCGVPVSERPHEECFEVSFLIQGFAKTKAGDKGAEITRRVDDWRACRKEGEIRRRSV